MATLDMTSLARRGAEVRIKELHAEVDALLSMFPDLRSERTGSTQGRKTSAVAHGRTASPAPSGRRRRTPMTAAQRRAVGVRMKKYWAARRRSK